VGSRPGLDRLLEAFAAVISTPSLLLGSIGSGRILRHLSATLGELDDLGVQFVSVHEAFGSLGPAGRLQRNILFSVAQYEQEQMLERSKSGLRAKAQAGWWPGGPPPVRVPAGAGRALAIDDDDAAILRRVVDLIVDENLSTVATADALNAAECSTRHGRVWKHQNLRRYLLDAPWSGTWRYGRGRGWQRMRNDGIVHAQLPAIIHIPERHLALLEHLHRTSRDRQGSASPLLLPVVAGPDVGDMRPAAQWRHELRHRTPLLRLSRQPLADRAPLPMPTPLRRRCRNRGVGSRRISTRPRHDDSGAMAEAGQLEDRLHQLEAPDL
jgi:DNA invertase Pin-like site-specific DNA recombinase